jgi:hypothetical protein
MSEQLRIIGQNNAAAQSELPKAKTSPQLKLCSEKASNIADTLIAQLGDLEKNEELTPDDIDVQLFQISKRIDRLTDPKGREDVQKLYNSAAYNATFPIIKELYERN